MALGDPVNQTKDKKKLPLISQQIQGGAGGINTVADGSNNMPQAGRQGPYVLPTRPLTPLIPQVQKDRAGGIVRDTSTFTPTRGTATPNIPTAPAIPGVKRIGDEFSGTTGSWDKPMVTVIPGDSTITSPAQIGQRPVLPNNMIGAGDTSTIASTTPPALGDTASRITNVDGLKTLNIAGGTISSRSPNLGNITPEALADLDKRIAMDRDPEVAARRAESVAMADQRHNDYLRGGLSRNEYENPTGSTQLMKSMLVAKSRGDAEGYKTFQELLTSQLGNETTRAGQKITAENARLSGQSDAAKLGQTQLKDQITFDAAQQNKGIDQSINVQKAQAEIEKNVSNLINSPEYMNESKLPSQTFSDVNRLGGDVAKSLDSIVGPETANRFRNERDMTRRAQLLQKMGLSPDQVKLMLTRYQQQ